jgi:catechol 2,3-dioxygenase-like lactoylglutathione lyase family enzyme
VTRRFIGLVSLLVRDYDEAIEFYVGKLGFAVVEDTYIAAQDKRWVVVAPPESNGAQLLLAKAVGEEQTSRIGSQSGGRVFLFLYTYDFDRDFLVLKSKGIEFVREPKVEGYGTVAVFRDLYGNLWDLLQLK